MEAFYQNTKLINGVFLALQLTEHKPNRKKQKPRQR